MAIQSLEISGLRNLRSMRLENCGQINILFGANGSGKTSILEAIHLLGLGRSFRSSRIAPVINHEMEACVVYAQLKGETESYQSVGMSRTRQGRQETHINKMPVEGIIELARVLPLQLINADTFALIDGGPKMRRQFMDWGVFHVKPAFLGHWRNAQRCLKQRNHLLRAQKMGRRGRIYTPEIAAWDKELALSSASIDEYRARYIEDIRPVFNEVFQRLTSLSGLSLDYQRGWRANIDLQAALEENFERDVSLGSTTAGPHRASIGIHVDGRPAIDVLSRGQLKLVVSSLRLAQGRLLAEQSGTRCIYLVDDLPAELDKEHRLALCGFLDEMGCQVFITSVDADAVGSFWPDKQLIRQFHVKQGQITSSKTI